MQALIKEYPSYLDPHMRLAYMEYSLNRIEEGEKILRDVLADSHHSISLPPNATQEVCFLRPEIFHRDELTCSRSCWP
jgi:hypothetical protein